MSAVISLSDYRQGRREASNAAIMTELKLAIGRVQELAERAFPDITGWHMSLNDDGAGAITDWSGSSFPLALAAIQPPPAVDWDGAGVYEFRLLDDSERGYTAQPIAFLDRAPERDTQVQGRCFRWQHVWKGKLQRGRAKFVHELRIHIIRKLESLPELAVGA